MSEGALTAVWTRAAPSDLYGCMIDSFPAKQSVVFGSPGDMPIREAHTLQAPDHHLSNILVHMAAS